MLKYLIEFYQVNKMSSTQVAVVLLFIAVTQLSAMQNFEGEFVERIPIVILPIDESNQDAEFLKVNEIVANALVAASVKLGRFEVFDRNKVQEIMVEHSLRLSLGANENDLSEEIDPWAMLEASTRSDKAFRVVVTNLNQKGIANEELGFLGQLFVSDEELEKNIETKVSVQFDLIDVRTNETINSFLYDGAFTGGTRMGSLTHALKGIESKITAQLKTIFAIQSYLRFDKNGNQILKFDEDIGIEEGQWFRLHMAQASVIIAEDTLKKSPRSFALSQVVEVHEKFALLKLRKYWDNPQGEIYAEELRNSPVGVNVFYSRNLSGNLMDIGIDILESPLNSISALLRLQAGNIDTPRDSITDLETAFHTGLGIGVSWHKGLSNQLALIGSSVIEFNLLHRHDDEYNLVNAFGVSVPVELGFEYGFMAKTSLYAGAGYRLFGSHFGWNYSEEIDEDKSITIPAKWEALEGGEPAGQVGGAYFRVGIMRYIF